MDSRYSQTSRLVVEIEIPITSENTLLKATLTEALRSYRNDQSVIVLAKGGGCLHGCDELRDCIDRELSFTGTTIKNIDAHLWERSDIPQVLEVARKAFLLRMEEANDMET
jgi:hypothetical protein